MKYEIYQLDYSKESVKNSRKMFERWEWLIKYDGGFNFKDYKKVYDEMEEGEDNIDILDKLFEKFNLAHPDDFHGHSLSVSDVIILDDKMYYCDSIGWKEIK